MTSRGSDSRQPKAASSRHLRTVGPFVWHFSGRVVQVFGTSQRPRPSTAPLRSATLVFIVVVTLPYTVPLLPVLVLLFVAWLWLRRRGWVRRRPRLLRTAKRSASDAGLLVTSFRVRLARDDDQTQACDEIDCRLVQRAHLGCPPLVGGEDVVGRGQRTAVGVVEVSRLQLPDSRVTLRATSPKSTFSVQVLASLIVAVGAGVLYFQWDQIPPIDVNEILSLLGIVFGCLLLLQMIKFTLRRIF